MLTHNLNEVRNFSIGIFIRYAHTLVSLPWPDLCIRHGQGARGSFYSLVFNKFTTMCGLILVQRGNHLGARFGAGGHARREVHTVLVDLARVERG